MLYYLVKEIGNQPSIIETTIKILDKRLLLP